MKLSSTISTASFSQIIERRGAVRPPWQTISARKAVWRKWITYPINGDIVLCRRRVGLRRSNDEQDHDGGVSES